MWEIRAMQVRPGRPTDIAAIEELVERAYALYIPRIGRRPAPMDADYAERVDRGCAFVAEDGGAIAGVIVQMAEPDHLFIEILAVDPARQGEGIGRALLAFAEDRARESGLGALRLYTNAAMTENLAFYPRLGYDEIGRRTENGFERVLFSKTLA
jgi:ribosomal protein S18 acetylase RimI-like enzyme